MEETLMKISVLAVSLSLLLATNAHAAFIGPSDARKVVTTVQVAVDSENDTTCVLDGNIVRHLDKNRYAFEDKSGTMTVDIPPHVFGQVDVTPKDTVRLTGEMTKKKTAEHPDTHLRVRYIEKLS